MVELTGGQSREDRISFTVSNDVATAIRKSNNEIEIKFGKELQPSPAIVEIILGIIFWTITFIKACIIVPLIKKGILATEFYLIAAFTYLLIAIIAIIKFRITEGKETLKNHAAEHKVFLAYNKLKRVPTIEEAKTFSRINRKCGITIYSGFITIQIIAFIIYIYTGCMISEIILFIGALLLRSKFPFNILGKFAQLFTTSEPDNDNIELAISAVSALEEKQQLKENIGKLLVKNIFKF